MQNSETRFEMTSQKRGTVKRQKLDMENVNWPFSFNSSRIGSARQQMFMDNSSRKDAIPTQKSDEICEVNRDREPTNHPGEMHRCRGNPKSNVMSHDAVGIDFAPLQSCIYGARSVASRVIKVPVSFESRSGRTALQSSWIQRLIPASHCIQKERLKGAAVFSPHKHSSTSNVHIHSEEESELTLDGIPTNKPRENLKAEHHIFENSRTRSTCTIDKNVRAREKQDIVHVDPVSLPQVESLLIRPRKSSDVKTGAVVGCSKPGSRCEGEPSSGTLHRRNLSGFDPGKEEAAALGSSGSDKNKAIQGFHSLSTEKVLIGFGPFQVTLQRRKLLHPKADPVHAVSTLCPPADTMLRSIPLSRWWENSPALGTETTFRDFHSSPGVFLKSRPTSWKEDGECDGYIGSGGSQLDSCSSHVADMLAADVVSFRETLCRTASKVAFWNNPSQKAVGYSKSTAEPYKVPSKRSVTVPMENNEFIHVDAFPRQANGNSSLGSDRARVNGFHIGTQQFKPIPATNKLPWQAYVDATGYFQETLASEREGPSNAECPPFKNPAKNASRCSPQSAKRRKVECASKELHGLQALHSKPTVASSSLKFQNTTESENLINLSEKGTLQHVAGGGIEESSQSPESQSESTSGTASLPNKVCKELCQTQGSGNSHTKFPVVDKEIEEEVGNLEKPMAWMTNTEVPCVKTSSFCSAQPWLMEDKPFRSMDYSTYKISNADDNRSIAAIRRGHLRERVHSSKGVGVCSEHKDHSFSQGTLEKEYKNGSLAFPPSNSPTFPRAPQTLNCEGQKAISSSTLIEKSANDLDSPDLEPEKRKDMLKLGYYNVADDLTDCSAVGANCPKVCLGDARSLLHDLQDSVGTSGPQKRHGNTRKSSEEKHITMSPVLCKCDCSCSRKTNELPFVDNAPGWMEWANSLGNIRDQDSCSKSQMWLQRWNPEVITRQHPLPRKTVKRNATMGVFSKTKSPVSFHESVEDSGGQRHIFEEDGENRGFISRKCFLESGLGVARREIHKDGKELCVLREFLKPSAGAMAIMAKHIDATQSQRKNSFGDCPSSEVSLLHIQESEKELEGKSMLNPKKNAQPQEKVWPIT